MLLEFLAEGFQPFRDSSKEVVHALEVFILVEIEKALKALPHKLGVATNENILGFQDKRLASLCVQVTLDAVFFLFQALLCLLEVIRHTVRCNEGLGFVLVVDFG